MPSHVPQINRGDYNKALRPIACNIGLPGLIKRVQEGVKRTKEKYREAYEQETARMRRKKKQRALLSQTKNSRRSTVRALLRQIQVKRGSDGEQRVVELVEALVAAGKLARFVHAVPHDALDAMHIDIVVWRKDGAAVPIQIKSSYTGREEFLAKYTEHFLRECGALPIVVISPPGGFRNANRKKQALYREIWYWKGKFTYDPDLKK